MDKIDLNIIHKVKQLFKEVECEMEVLEMYKILEEVTKYNPKTIVEIGVKYGGTLNVWRNFLSSDSIIIGIDSDNSLKFNINEDSRIKFIQGNSLDYGTYQKFLSILGNRKIDFLFIDGGHVYREAKSDLYTFGWHVRKGGIIAFHDIWLDSEGEIRGCSKHLWNEVKNRSGKYWKVTKEIEEHTGTGIIEIL